MILFCNNLDPFTKFVVNIELASAVGCPFFKVAPRLLRNLKIPIQESEVCPGRFPRHNPPNKRIPKSSGALFCRETMLLLSFQTTFPSEEIDHSQACPCYKSTIQTYSCHITITSESSSDRYHSDGNRHGSSYSDTKSPAYEELGFICWLAMLYNNRNTALCSNSSWMRLNLQASVSFHFLRLPSE